MYVTLGADASLPRDVYRSIEKRIKHDGYTPKTSMHNLIVMSVLSFDDDEVYDTEEYGNDFTIDGLCRYVEDCGGWEEFDWYC